MEANQNKDFENNTFGNTNSNDWYTFTGITLTYAFGKSHAFVILNGRLNKSNRRKSTAKSCCNDHGWKWKMGKKRITKSHWAENGTKTVKTVVETSAKIGIKNLTLYAFL